MSHVPSMASILASRLEAIPTRWSLVATAHAGAPGSDATQARQALVLRYARSIRRYVGGMVRDTTDADEVAQDVVLRIMRGDFAGADPNRGRFRDLLKTAVRNMVRSHWAKARKPVALDLDTVEDDPAWTDEWQANVLDLVWQAMRKLEHESPGKLTHTVLRLRADRPDATSDELAAAVSAQVGVEVKPEAFRQMLRRARMRFAEALVTEVGIGLADPSPDRVTEELAALGLLEHVRDFIPT